jgi:dTDP-4-amino-4,6-dideoxygalactose transaminase
LSLALLALGIKPGSEVVTSPASFIATANSAIHAGALPRFADIEMRTYGIDPKTVAASCSGSTKAIIPVHLYGQPVDFDGVRTVAQERDLRVVEDACQAHGAVYRGKKVGSLGDAGCFSFYPTKNMTVLGDGGMVVTNDENLAGAVAKLRDCGRKSRYLHDVIGFTYRLNTVNAAAGRAQLMRLDEWNQTRRRNARLYHKFLQGLDDVVLPRVTEEDETPVFHQFVIRTSRRDELSDWLAKRGIETGIHYPLPIHLQPIYRDLYGYTGGEYPNSELLCRTCLSLPVNPTLTPDDIEYVAREIRIFLGKEP